MRAMVLEQAPGPLMLRDWPVPEPRPGQMLLRVLACGVCRTDLHIVDGELTDARLPLVPGHQLVGVVAALGAGVANPTIGTRVGVPWLGWACGECEYCRTGRENLCDRARFTGYHHNGGFAEFAVAEAAFCLALPDTLPDAEVAPLLCAGLIGYRALSMTAGARRIGFFGFGSAAHILTQVARGHGREVYAFTRPGDIASQDFARSLGATWAGGTDQAPPEPLDAAILFAPVGAHVPRALALVQKGGSVICAGIHMSDIPSFPYSLLWGERTVRSVANLTRQDGIEFLALAGQLPPRTLVREYSLDQANLALADLRAGRIQGSAVLVV